MVLRQAIRRAANRVIGNLAPSVWKSGRGGKLVVLMYHRVLPIDSPEAAVEQPGMVVSPNTLDMHFATLRQHFELIHLEEWVKRAAEQRTLPKVACAVTFDDGWRDNVEFALPIIERRQVPATIFLVSSLVDQPVEFWPNTVSRVISSELLQPGEVTWPRALADHLDGPIARVKRGEWSQQRAVDAAIDSLKDLDDRAARELLSPFIASGQREVVNREEISRLSRSGLVRFGSHSKTHRRLRPGVTAEDLEIEISHSRRELQDICGQSIDLFCYPNGNKYPDAIEAVRANYSGAVTTSRGWFEPQMDMCQIPRIGIHEDVAKTDDALITRLAGWI